MAITYTPSVNFGAKDSLPTNDPDKVIKGSEFTTEFTAIQTAFSLAAPSASPTFTGTVTIASVDINGGAIDGTTIGGSSAAAGTFTNLEANGTVKLNGNFPVGTNNVALGENALGDASLSGGTNTAIGDNALFSNTIGSANAALGGNAMYSNLSGQSNAAVGNAALFTNNTGSYNAALGAGALYFNTASYNVAAGYRALYTNSTGADNVAVGYYALYTNSTGGSNVAVGESALTVATGSSNTAIGKGAGSLITTGAKNTIIGTYNGNQGGLDIRTANNHIVLSDGDGNPRAYHNGTLWTLNSLNVDGTVTADGLTVDGATVLDVGDEGTLQVGPTTTVADENQTIEMRGSNGGNELQRFQIANRGEDGRVDFKFGCAGATPTKAISIGAATGDISFYEDTGTTPKFFWDASAERLGLGTTSPATKLEILDGNSIGLRFGDVAAAPSSQTAGYIGMSTSAFSGNNGDLVLYPRTSAASNILLMGGNVGIGTTSPAVRADIHKTDGSGRQDTVRVLAGGNATNNGASLVLGSTQTQAGYVSGIQTATNGGALVFGVHSSGAYDEAARIDSSGRLLVGTTSNLGGGALQINANSVGETIYTAYISNTNTSTSAYNVMRWEQGAAGSARGMIGTGGSATGNVAFRNNFVVGTQTSSPLVFATGDAERARIDSSGNLLVGTTTQYTSSAHIVTNTATATYGICIRDTGQTTGAINFENSSGTQVGSIILSATTTTYNTSSDARLKENIADAEDASSLVDAIKVRQFDWKADGSHQRYGMVAQELLEVAPEAVSQGATEDDMMGVDYSKLVPMLVKEIQSLRARVAQLEGA